MNKEIKPANYAKINHLSEVFVSQKAKSREELYFSNISKTTIVSKSISKPNEEFSDDTSPSVARKFLNEVKSTIVTLQRVVKQKISLDIHSWSSSAHQELLKIIKDEIYPIVNQVDARVQNFEIQFLKEATKFVRDFKSLINEADESLAKHKALEFEIECLLKAVVSQDIMSIVQNNSVVDTLNLQTELDQCKYDKISYDKAYNDMQQKIERLQAQLGDLKGKSKDTLCKSNTLDPLFLNKRTPPKVIPKVGETNALSKPVTSKSAPSFRESTVVNNKRVIAPGIFRINSLNISRIDTFVPNKHVKASIRTKPITASQPHVVTKEDVNSNTNGLPSKEVESTTKTIRPQTRSNPKNDRPPSKSSKGNKIKLAIRNEKSEVVCATCKQCLITANHDKCVFKYVNGMNSRKKNKSANVSKSENQKKHKPNVKNSKKLGSDKESLASPRPSKPRTCLRWIPTGRIFYLCGKITASSNNESESDTYVCDNASASNPQEPTSKGFSNSTSFLNRFMRIQRQNTCIHPFDGL
ncbi:hypothetical protein Tco_1091306 [Tanacetum coccineum]|uniref:Uncharacterized protein n=1 Tax=Tanacetum coccineum TaxID=301880 RepID=A0ABQ5I6S3_9ASTR